MENTYASKHFFFNKKYLSYNQNLTAICSGYNLPAATQKFQCLIHMSLYRTERYIHGFGNILILHIVQVAEFKYQLAFFRQFVDGADDMLSLIPGLLSVSAHRYHPAGKTGRVYCTLPAWLLHSCS